MPSLTHQHPPLAVPQPPFIPLMKIDENWYIGVSEIADQNFAIGLLKFKMAETVWRLKLQKKLRVC